ncbi:sirohydrochlorin cobaltochelatase [Peptostreptococcus anaerobius]|uniref:sirohydrochlorin cobaltochelatase n=1 Tax=Peptostreptococcus anaerobius TaxID=1261 RepID=UPI001D0668BA|nr:sirohydrochlorin cobaltochelatase [Peptostreptococcus anaerobius]MCB6983602.1 sirohydrochlorin cobaltochelatase [Peptostreptococcus anaerobius]MCQ5151429.1 sirohydrochlorin cobaltochelatase [Peptostreptococcus anaerobius]
MANKKALLVVSFGTSYADTRKLTIEACEDKIRQEFKDHDFFRAWTSRKIIKKLKEKENTIIKFPDEVMEEIYQAGYDEVLVQSLHIINGEEFDKIKDICRCYKDKFDKIVLGRPLLSSPKDYDEVTDIIEKMARENLGDNPEDGEVLVLMGHGTEHVAHASYAGLEYRIKVKGLPVYVGTVEGYPDVDTVIDQLKKDGIHKVHLRPFLLVAGVHAKKDMAGDSEDSWKTKFTRAGFDVVIHLESLGQMEEVQDMFLRNLKEEI